MPDTEHDGFEACVCVSACSFDGRVIMRREWTSVHVTRLPLCLLSFQAEAA